DKGPRRGRSIGRGGMAEFGSGRGWRQRLLENVRRLLARVLPGRVLGPRALPAPSAEDGKLIEGFAVHVEPEGELERTSGAVDAPQTGTWEAISRFPAREAGIDSMSNVVGKISQVIGAVVDV